MRSGDRETRIPYIEGPTFLACAHIHQRTSSLDARERLAAFATAAPPSREAIALVTCHRVEVYAAVAAGRDPAATIAELLGTTTAALGEAEILTGGEVARHLFRAAAGLDSAIVGEGQILSQLRRAYDVARAGRLDPILTGLFQRALHLGRTLRADTPLGAVRRSVGSLAVDAAIGQLRDPSAATALVVGAGEIGKLAARALATRVARLLIANRDISRATELAGNVGAEVVPLDTLAAALDQAHVLISAADTRGLLLTRSLLEPRAATARLVVIDIAVPRSVAEDARTLTNVVYRDIDDLAARATDIPDAVLVAAERRCSEETAAFVDWLHERTSAATIRALHTRAEAIRQDKLERALRHLGHLTERDRAIVGSLAAALTHAILHEPTIRARRSTEAEQAARTLFGVGE